MPVQSAFWKEKSERIGQGRTEEIIVENVPENRGSLSKALVNIKVNVFHTFSFIF